MADKPWTLTFGPTLSKSKVEYEGKQLDGVSGMHIRLGAPYPDKLDNAFYPRIVLVLSSLETEVIIKELEINDGPDTSTTTSA